MEVIIGAIYEYDVFVECKIVGKFDTQSDKIFYVKQFKKGAYSAHSPESLSNYNSGRYKEEIESMDLDDNYVYHYGSTISLGKLICQPVKATRLALKMYPEATKTDCGGFIYV